jgi:hypothetical protein
MLRRFGCGHHEGDAGDERAHNHYREKAANKGSQLILRAPAADINS